MIVTLGKGLRNPAGFRVEVDDLAQKFLEDRPVVEAWWSPHVFEGDRRKSERWQGAQAIAIDVDALVNGET